MDTPELACPLQTSPHHHGVLLTSPASKYQYNQLLPDDHLSKKVAFTYKTHSEMADFPPVPPPLKLDETLSVVFESGPFAPLYENKVSSIKSEVHYVLYCRQKKIEAWPQVTCTENLVQFGSVIFQIMEQTDRQTNILCAILCKVKMQRLVENGEDEK